ncbi:MAG: hypothetical protein BGO26_15800 [Actinobacteria bacterium 69-20]|nr:DUF3040 domain-containing protein [Actinomycetota bacterium]OJV28765.1 MAG: hypothetical protein BGO26_15800 [Actinobacteria bacterium 69-20]
MPLSREDRRSLIGIAAAISAQDPDFGARMRWPLGTGIGWCARGVLRALVDKRCLWAILALLLAGLGLLVVGSTNSAIALLVTGSVLVVGSCLWAAPWWIAGRRHW